MSAIPAFNFSTVPSIVSEPGASLRLGQLVAERFPGIQRVLVVTDPGFLRTGLADPPRASLERQGMQVSVYSDVVVDPPEAVVHAAAQFARHHGVELVIGLGGGSSMDVAKLVAVLAGSDQPLAEMYGINKVSN